MNDQNPCTADSCDPVTGVAHTPVAAGTSCSDGNACNGNETCNAAGTCIAGTPPTLDDGNPCTTDACDPVNGVTHTPVAAGTSCSDNNICNGTETCNGSGSCIAGTPPSLDDGNPCTADSCDPVAGITHTPVAAGTSCSDGNACNGNETCNAAGACTPGTPPNIDDGNPCTADACDPETGSITHTQVPAGTSCSSNNVCTSGQTCNAQGQCQGGTPVNVDDGDPATIDTCQPGIGIKHRRAAAIDPTVITTTLAANQWLFTGSDPIQTGVAPGTIVLQRAAVLHGYVKDTQGQPIPNVNITVLGHPEFGATITHADGRYDMVVNGGGQLTVKYQLTGYLQVQRAVNASWDDQTWASNVVQIPADPNVTPVDLTSADQFQVAQGSVNTDADGSRQATVLFPADNIATMTLPDGTTQTITSLSVRATEFTVGDSGPAAMPAELPAATAYTYAIELNADEAVAAGATSVTFTNPLPLYINNFLGFCAGTIVPMGSYNRSLGQWVAEGNGLVINILGISGGMAQIGVDTSGNPATAAQLAAIGITNTELQKLATLYVPGQSLWRAQVQHFTSPIDLNWPKDPPTPTPPPPSPPDGGDDDCGADCSSGSGSGTGSGSGSGDSSGSGDGSGSSDGSGSGDGSGLGGGLGGGLGSGSGNSGPTTCGNSILMCAKQVYSETMPVAGTPFKLVYESDRVPGYKKISTLTIPLVGTSFDSRVLKIYVGVRIAGRDFQFDFLPQAALGQDFNLLNQDGDRYTYEFRPSANLAFPFAWDGKDLNGATPVGTQRATLAVGYFFDSPYWTVNRFGLPAQVVANCGATAVSGRPPTLQWWKHEVSITNVGPWDARGAGLGGWTLSAHHTYDARSHRVEFGSGGHSLGAADLRTLDRVAGQCGIDGNTGDNGPALNATISGYTRSVAVGPDGSVYLAQGVTSDAIDSRVRKIDPFGTITTVAGGSNSTALGDGGLAVNANFDTIRDVAVAPDGSLYLADGGHNRIRRIDPNGIVTTIAGTGVAGFSGDNGPATSAQINDVRNLALGPDGSIFISETGNDRIRRVGADGIITTYAGGGPDYADSDEVPATQTTFCPPNGIDVSSDGTLYIAAGGCTRSGPETDRVRKVTPDGIIHFVAGLGPGGLDVDGSAMHPQDVAVTPDGTVYVVTQAGTLHVLKDGIGAQLSGGVNRNCPLSGWPSVGTNISRHSYRPRPKRRPLLQPGPNDYAHSPDLSRLGTSQFPNAGPHQPRALRV